MDDIANKPKKLTYMVNGEKYKSTSEIPDFIIKAFEGFEDKDGNGIPDILEIDIDAAGGDTSGAKFIVNGKAYAGMEELKDAMGEDFVNGVLQQIGPEYFKKLAVGGVKANALSVRRLIFILIGLFILYQYLFKVLLPALGWI